MTLFPKQTDNHDPAAKLDLRRHFLRAYHQAAPPHVLDCCQGSGLLWSTLRQEFALASYWGLDQKPRKGRLQIDSTRILAQPGWRADVVDVDTYGSPWKHWLALLPNIRKPVTVFLTLGRGCAAPLGGDDALVLRLLALPSHTPKMLKASAGHQFGPAACLGQAARYHLVITEAQEALSDRPTRYLGVRLEPAAA